MKKMLLYYQYGYILFRPGSVTATDIQRRPHPSSKGTMEFVTLAIGFFLFFSFGLPLGAEEQDPAAGHPRPSCEHYSGEEMEALAGAVRKSRPQMHRGGWEWDRLLSRFIDGGRKRKKELRILKAYFFSIVDRYRESHTAGFGSILTLFENHRS